MNTEIHNAFLNALLADASYVEGLRSDDTGDVLSEALSNRLTSKLARYVGDNIKVITQFTAPGSSGFSVTVFEEITTGQKYVSFRGTEPSDWTRDFGTDGDAYFGTGLARSQIIEVANWYLRATAPTSDMFVNQFYLNRPIDLLTGELGPATYQVQGEGTLLGAGMLIVDGHSLGGHLTTVFTRLFASDIFSSYTYNGLGVGRLFPETFLRELESELGLGTTTWPDATKQKNFYAEHGISVATTSSWLSQKGQRIPLFNEEGTGIPNHLMYKLTDSLALADVMGMMDNSLSLATVTRIFDAASSTPVDSLEKILDSLRKAVSNQTTRTAVGDAESSAATRVDFHTKLAELRDAIRVAGEGHHPVVSLAGMGADVLTLAAKSGGPYLSPLSVRYALKEFNPFLIDAPDAFYAQHNINGRLDLYDQNTGLGELTDEYLADRAAFLVWKNRLAIEDADASGAAYNKSGATEAWFRDNATNLTINLGSGVAPADKPRYIFDGDNADTLSGGSQADHLYGGGGNDVLYGYGQNDRLEGGAGDDELHGGDQDDTLVGGVGADRLYGGKGFDTYIVGQGTDTLLDEDGQGIVKDGHGRAIAGLFVKAAGDGYVWAGDAQITAAREGSHLRITLGENYSVLLQNFVSGQLGIRLAETATSATDNTILGDRHPAEYSGVVFQVSGGAMQGIGSDWVEINWLNDWYDGDTHYWNIGYRRKDAWGNYLTDADDDYQAASQAIDANGYAWAYTVDHANFDVTWMNLVSHEADARLVGAGDVIYADAGDDVLNDGEGSALGKSKILCNGKSQSPRHGGWVANDCELRRTA